MINSADHSEREHDEWSASSTERNVTCAGAIALNSRVKTPEKESEAAAWGTACHQLSEKCFKTGKDADEYIGTVEKTKQRKIEVDEEVAETTQMAVPAAWTSTSGPKSFPTRARRRHPRRAAQARAASSADLVCIKLRNTSTDKSPSMPPRKL